MEATLAAVYLGVFPAAVGYVTWAYVLARLPVARTTSFLYLVPPMTLVIAFGLTREVPAVTTLLGGALAIAGVAIVNLRRKLAPVVKAPAARATAA